MLRKTYKITNWRRWDRELDSAVQDFHQRTKMFPNVLLASPVTFARINLAASKKNVGKATGEEPDPHEYTDLTGFVGEGYVVMFAERENVAEGSYALLYDSDPSGGGEPWPDVDTVVAATSQRRLKAAKK